ncbi:MAG: hypothetical protein V4850_30540 [Myxococcota bacterium]
MRDLLARAHAVYETSPGDLSTWQVVEGYVSAENQWKYVHMYFAKSVACWRYIREAVAPVQDGPVVSIGAGPGLCLLGWFFDRPPAATWPIHAHDVLAWDAVRADPAHVAVLAHVLAPAVMDFHAGRYFPATLPPQAATCVGAPIAPEQIPRGATVLLPFVLNHLFGSAPHPNPADINAWFRAVCSRAQRVVIVDMDYRPESSGPKSTHVFWSNLLAGLGLPLQAPCPVFAFNAKAAEFAACYDEVNGRRRTGIQYPQFCRATGIVGDAGVWRYIG